MVWGARSRASHPGSPSVMWGRPGRSQGQRLQRDIAPPKTQKTDKLPDVFVYTERNFVALFGEFD